MGTNKNEILDLSFQFALCIIEYCDVLESFKKFSIAKQLLRSGTSIGANVFESQHAESRKDFVHKMKIASKEASETDYWLRLCEDSLNYPDIKKLNIQLLSIQKLLTKIITSTLKNKVN